MKLFVEFGADDFLPMVEVNETDFAMLKPSDMLGIPRFWCQKKDDGLRVWPKPVPTCKLFRLEPQVCADVP
jgi:hypothetical protein